MENKLYDALIKQNTELVLNQTQINYLNELNERLKKEIGVLKMNPISLNWNSIVPNTVELRVEHVVDHALSREIPDETDKYLKAELARKLAQKMIDEDLITIYHDFDIDCSNDKYIAKVKFIQA